MVRATNNSHNYAYLKFAILKKLLLLFCHANRWLDILKKLLIATGAIGSSNNTVIYYVSITYFKLLIYS
jgi:hypothetical protein